MRQERKGEGEKGRFPFFSSYDFQTIRLRCLTSPEQFWRSGPVRFPSVVLPDIRHRESLLIDVIPDNLCYLGFLSDGYPPETAGMTKKCVIPDIGYREIALSFPHVFGGNLSESFSDGCLPQTRRYEKMGWIPATDRRGW